MRRLSAAPPAAFLLALFFLGAAGAGRELQPGSRLAAGAARAALHYLNFQAGSPGALRALGQVRKATLKVQGGGGGSGFEVTLGKGQ